MTGVRHDTGNKLGFLKAVVYFALRRPDLAGPFREYLAAFGETAAVRRVARARVAQRLRAGLWRAPARAVAADGLDASLVDLAAEASSSTLRAFAVFALTALRRPSGLLALFRSSLLVLASFASFASFASLASLPSLLALFRA